MHSTKVFQDLILCVFYFKDFLPSLFHVVQASLLLTHHLPLKETLVLLTTIPKGILIFFYTQFI